MANEDDGGDWLLQQRINTRGDLTFGSSEGPSVAVMGERVYVAWKGSSSDTQAWYTYWDEHVGWWAPQRTIPGVRTPDGPRLAAFNNKLYAVWRNSDDTMGYSAMERKFHVGTKPQTIPGAGTGRGLSIATAGYGQHEAMFAAWRGVSDEDIYFSIMEKKTVWSTQQRLSKGLSSVGPAVACYGYGDGEVLHAAWRGNGSNTKLYFATMARKDSDWSPQKEIPDAASDFGPALVQYKDCLYAAWRSTDGNETLCWSRLERDGNWHGPTKVYGNPKTKYEPTLTVFDGSLCIAWRGQGSDAAIYYDTIST